MSFSFSSHSKNVIFPLVNKTAFSILSRATFINSAPFIDTEFSEKFLPNCASNTAGHLYVLVSESRLTNLFITLAWEDVKLSGLIVSIFVASVK